MKENNTDQITSKIELSLLAAELYQKKGRLSMRDLINKSEISITMIYDLFPNKDALISYAYPSMVFQYWAMIDEIDDFHKLVISEKLGNFIYSMFEMFSDHELFVKDTFTRLVACKGVKSDFADEVSAVYKDFLTRDSNLSITAGLVTRPFFYRWMTSQFIAVIEYWIRDTSTNKERTIGLVDKACSLFEDVLYSELIDKGFDFSKYLYTTLNTTFRDKS
ncbi:MAG: hypothetical protein CL672_02720 [Balneola sp.]|nr:hypothetical protein [Balneola sp.]|tara:strand:- start:310 stop:969 length:660 start_codon:yes stop_codon:yes gene_type:complete